MDGLYFYKKEENYHNNFFNKNNIFSVIKFLGQFFLNIFIIMIHNNGYNTKNISENLKYICLSYKNNIRV